MVIDQRACLDKTTPLQSAWSMALTAVTVEYEQFIYLFISKPSIMFYIIIMYAHFPLFFEQFVRNKISLSVRHILMRWLPQFPCPSRSSSTSVWANTIPSTWTRLRGGRGRWVLCVCVIVKGDKWSSFLGWYSLHFLVPFSQRDRYARSLREWSPVRWGVVVSKGNNPSKAHLYTPASSLCVYSC